MTSIMFSMLIIQLVDQLHRISIRKIGQNIFLNTEYNKKKEEQTRNEFGVEKIRHENHQFQAQ